MKLFKWWNGALSLQDGALTQLYVACSPEIEEKNLRAQYFVPIAQQSPLDSKAPKITQEMKTKLWELSEDLTKIKYEL